MVRAFLLLGSNEGDRLGFLAKARQEISASGNILSMSSIYETAAWGNTQQAAFLNQVVEIETNLKPTPLLKSLLSIETSLGRRRTGKWSSRTIDIDILFYGDEIIQETELTIPHPAIAQRRFTLVPLAELTPDFVHPVLKRKMWELLEECGDKLEVEVFLQRDA